jgi:MurNAc alpha-1-phosphate uridylyltransferase
VPTGLCAVLLAAGEGMRLRPLTDIVPKALCPVGNVALLDRALAAVAGLGFTGRDDVAVNAWHLPDALIAHTQQLRSAELAHRIAADRQPTDRQPTDRQPSDPLLPPFLGVEAGPRPLGSSGGLAALRDWIDGRDVLVGNADAYLAGGRLDALVADWTGDQVRMLGVPAGPGPTEFGAFRFAGFSVLPWRHVARLRAEPSNLVATVWRPAEAAGELTMISYSGTYIDCGTPADYLAANLHEGRIHGVDGALIAPDATVTGSATASVIGAGARVDGDVFESVVWPGAAVGSDERLRNAIRYGQRPADTLATV